MLLGLPLAVIVFTQWWLSDERGQEEKGERGKEKKAQKKKAPATVATFPLFPFYPVSPSLSRMAAAGVVAGLLPLVHAHSFIAVMMVGACLALLQRRWRDWVVFFFCASSWRCRKCGGRLTTVRLTPASFFDWQFGWDRGTENIAWFWFKNTGLFIPLLVAAILWRGKDYLVPRRLLVYYLPFTLCFIVPNLIKLAPWVWDNIKVLYYWWLSSAPLIALLLSRLWHQRGVRRVLAVVLFACLTLAGSLDVASIVMRRRRTVYLMRRESLSRK